MERLFQWLDSFKSANLVRAAFGDAREEAGRTIIPVAMVVTGVSEQRQRRGGQMAPDAPPDERSAAFVRPMGVISIGSDGVRVHEVVDRTALSLVGVSLAGILLLFLYGLLGSPSRRAR